MDEPAGAEVYGAQRAGWDYLINGLVAAMAYAMDEIDPAAGRPEDADEQPEF